jgi:hypothetical protein
MQSLNCAWHCVTYCKYGYVIAECKCFQGVRGKIPNRLLECYRPEHKERHEQV